MQDLKSPASAFYYGFFLFPVFIYRFLFINCMTPQL